jgi:hypothetical protein
MRWIKKFTQGVYSSTVRYNKVIIESFGIPFSDVHCNVFVQYWKTRWTYQCDIEDRPPPQNRSQESDITQLPFTQPTISVVLA